MVTLFFGVVVGVAACNTGWGEMSAGSIDGEAGGGHDGMPQFLATVECGVLNVYMH